MAFSRYCLTQVRSSVNFFARYREDELWKTVTSVSPAGMKKGRKNTRQPIRPLQNFYRIGSSPMKILYPGLNSPTRNAIHPISIQEMSDEERENNVLQIRKKLEKRGKIPRRRVREKLHPLERGFSGNYVMGQKLGSPPSFEGINFNDFQTYCLELKRTCHMTRIFGRVFRIKAFVIIGNGKGLAGFGIGEAALFKSNFAIARAMKHASKHLFHVERLENRTIYQDFFAECRNCRIYAQRRSEGFGLYCHPRLQKICKVVGIKDLYAKVEGATRNYRALAQAFINGLVNQETHQKLAERTRLHVVKLDPTRQFLPEIVASPITAPVKSTEEIEPIEKLKLDDFYGEGRIPLYKDKPKPFYANTPGHLKAEFNKHPFRNMENRMIRLLADGVVSRWTRNNRHEYAKKEHELVLSGSKPFPIGIGLSKIARRAEEAH